MTITRGFQKHPAGSVLVEFGDTKVLCAASVTEGVPRWRKGSGLGWLTAEYAMLPSATNTRSDRESVKGRVGGRTHEISRLIGRSLRACIDLAALGENTIAARLRRPAGRRRHPHRGDHRCLRGARRRRHLARRARAASPTRSRCRATVAAVSVGVVDGRVRLDLPYEEDSRAEVDTNVVATDTGTLIEVQGTGEGATFTRATLDAMLDTALAGIRQLADLQAAALAEPYPGSPPVVKLLLATRNPGKLAELRRMLADRPSTRRGRGARARRRARVPGRARDGCDVRRERAGQGPRRGGRHRAARPSPTTRGSPSTR